MEGLHDRGLWALIEDNSCKRVSACGLIQDNPNSYKWLKEILLSEQLFLLMEALENKRDEVDKYFDIYINANGIVALFDKRSFYTFNHCCAICKLLEIDQELIKDYNGVTAVVVKGE